MGISGGPYIVRDSSLVLELDATDLNSYPGSGTTWKDLSGNNYTGSLINGPTFSSANGGSIVFDGTNDYATTNFSTQLGNFTAITWFKSSAPVVGRTYERILDKRFDNGFWMGRNQNIANQWGGGVLNNTAPTYGIFITLSDTDWHFLASVRSGAVHTIYGDGITNTNSIACSVSITSNATASLSTDNSATGYLTGNIGLIQIYNRALSATEILQNYNEQKSRFGL